MPGHGLKTDRRREVIHLMQLFTSGVVRVNFLEANNLSPTSFDDFRYTRGIAPPVGADALREHCMIVL